MKALDSLAVFLEVVEHDRDDRCRRILDDARQRAHELLQTARRDARRRVSDAARDDRQIVRRRVEAARAELGTRERQAKYEVQSTLLARGLGRLEVELGRRWEEPAARVDWMLAAVHCAGRVLAPGFWSVTLARQASEEEASRVREAVRKQSGAHPQLRQSEVIDAGIVIECRGACLDATLHGLLADPLAAGARLLMELAT